MCTPTLPVSAENLPRCTTWAPWVKVQALILSHAPHGSQAPPTQHSVSLRAGERQDAGGWGTEPDPYVPSLCLVASMQGASWPVCCLSMPGSSMVESVNSRRGWTRAVRTPRLSMALWGQVSSGTLCPQTREWPQSLQRPYHHGRLLAQPGDASLGARQGDFRAPYFCQHVQTWAPFSQGAPPHYTPSPVKAVSTAAWEALWWVRPWTLKHGTPSSNPGITK